LVGLLIIFLSVLGPLLSNIIKYKTSQSALYQIQGQDLINLLIVGPICLIGGVLELLHKKQSKYFLIFVPIYISFYTGLAYGLGVEWSHPAYQGQYNSNQYFWIFIILIFGGILITFYSYSQFSENDSPHFNPKTIRIFTIFWIFFIMMFIFMWLSEIMIVNATGDTTTGSYSESPNVFWVVKYLDLGITLPLGLFSLYLFNTRPTKAYPMLLLFFSFFLITSLTVNMMAIVMIVNNDQSIQLEGLIIFPVLFLLSLTGYIYLIKEKIPLRII
jgi:hypothetical protein